MARVASICSLVIYRHTKANEMWQINSKTNYSNFANKPFQPWTSSVALPPLPAPLTLSHWTPAKENTPVLHVHPQWSVVLTYLSLSLSSTLCCHCLEQFSSAFLFCLQEKLSNNKLPSTAINTTEIDPSVAHTLTSDNLPLVFLSCTVVSQYITQWCHWMYNIVLLETKGVQSSFKERRRHAPCIGLLHTAKFKCGSRMYYIQPPAYYLARTLLLACAAEATSTNILILALVKILLTYRVACPLLPFGDSNTLVESWNIHSWGLLRTRFGMG